LAWKSANYERSAAKSRTLHVIHTDLYTLAGAPPTIG
jgi:hypothetical protein